MHRYQFTPSVDHFRPGVVTIVKPLGPDVADLFETGPMWRVQYEDSPFQNEAFAEELVPLDDAPAPAWGDWWDADDHDSPGAVQFWIETGKRQTRRESFEHSIAAERTVLAAEALTRRASTGVTA